MSVPANDDNGGVLAYLGDKDFSVSTCWPCQPPLTCAYGSYYMVTGESTGPCMTEWKVGDRMVHHPSGFVRVPAKRAALLPVGHYFPISHSADGQPCFPKGSPADYAKSHPLTAERAIAATHPAPPPPPTPATEEELEAVRAEIACEIEEGVRAKDLESCVHTLRATFQLFSVDIESVIVDDDAAHIRVSYARKGDEVRSNYPVNLETERCEVPDKPVLRVEFPTTQCRRPTGRQLMAIEQSIISWLQEAPRVRPKAYGIMCVRVHGVQELYEEQSMWKRTGYGMFHKDDDDDEEDDDEEDDDEEDDDYYIK